MTAYDFFFWPHRLLIVGPSIETAVHQHHASQLVVGIGYPVAFENVNSGAYEEGLYAWIQPDAPHKMLGTSGSSAILFNDPESLECAEACEWFGHQQMVVSQKISRFENARNHLISESDNKLDRSSALQFVQAPPWSNKAGVRCIDPRLVSALDFIDNNLHEEIRLHALAKKTGVSTSWLSHHFSPNIGISIRSYILWGRLRLAIKAISQGARLTDAAHAANFYDAAHFSRYFKNTFGINPSTIFNQQINVNFHWMT